MFLETITMTIIFADSWTSISSIATIWIDAFPKVNVTEPTRIRIQHSNFSFHTRFPLHYHFYQKQKKTFAPITRTLSWFIRKWQVPTIINFTNAFINAFEDAHLWRQFSFCPFGEFPLNFTLFFNEKLLWLLIFLSCFSFRWFAIFYFSVLFRFSLDFH